MDKSLSLYVIVDAQYSPEYRAAQAVHAAVAYMLDNPDSSWKNNRLVILQTPNILELKAKLNFWGKKVSHFVEPDVGNKITALALVDDGRKLSKLKLN